jgi:glycosyltransferase involved in cell wall biosynthesis
MHKDQPQLGILLYDFASSGVARNAIRIAGHAASKGLRTELWVMRNGGPLKNEVPKEVAVFQIIGTNSDPSEVEPIQGFKRGISNLKTVPRLARIIRARKPQVLLSAGNHFHFAAGLAYRLAGRPIHTRLIGRASNATPRIGRKSTLLGALANRLDSMKYRYMRKIIVVSHELADDLNQRLHIPADRIIVIPNGIDVAEIERKSAEPLNDPWFAPDAPPVIISAGRLSRQKNFALLIEAFAQLRKARRARLVILGDGPRKWHRALAEQSAALGIQPDVRLAGYEPNPLRFFARAQLFVLTSLWEGASNVLLEALACGCPVVAADCPTGVREVLNGGEVGEIVKYPDAQSLSCAMARSLDALHDRQKLRSHASRYRLSDILVAYLELITNEVKLVSPEEVQNAGVPY